MKKKIIIVSAFLLLVSSVALATNGGGFWTGIQQSIGEYVGAGIMKTFDAGTLDNFGAASSVGTTQSTARIATVAVNYATTTIGSLYNNSGQDRIIMEIVSWMETSKNDKWHSSDRPFNWLFMDIATSTNPYTTSSPYYLAQQMPYVTSTSPVFTNTTTPNGLTVQGRMWQAGSYLNFKLDATTTHSTSTGVIGVKYFVR
jgi:hypothetical protein